MASFIYKALIFLFKINLVFLVHGIIFFIKIESLKNKFINYLIQIILLLYTTGASGTASQGYYQIMKIKQSILLLMKYVLTGVLHKENMQCLAQNILKNVIVLTVTTQPRQRLLVIAVIHAMVTQIRFVVGCGYYLFIH